MLFVEGSASGNMDNFLLDSFTFLYFFMLSCLVAGVYISGFTFFWELLLKVRKVCLPA